MAKRKSVKKSAAKTARKTVKRAKKAARSLDPLQQLKKLQAESIKVAEQYEKKAKQLAKSAINKKNTELSKAKDALKVAEQKVAELTSELNELRESTGAPVPKRRGPKPGARKGAKKAGRKPGPKKGAKKAGAKKGAKKAGGGRRGRKPRVEAHVKQEAVAKTLAKHPSGIGFGALKKELAQIKAPGGGKMFGAADFNSSATFGKKLLPKGYKIQGRHRAAKVVKS